MIDDDAALVQASALQAGLTTIIGWRCEKCCSVFPLDLFASDSEFQREHFDSCDFGLAEALAQEPTPWEEKLEEWETEEALEPDEYVAVIDYDLSDGDVQTWVDSLTAVPIQAPQGRAASRPR